MPALALCHILGWDPRSPKRRWRSVCRTVEASFATSPRSRGPGGRGAAAIRRRGRRRDLCIETGRPSQGAGRGPSSLPATPCATQESRDAPRQLPARGARVVQAEDEIAGVGSAIGASFGGALAVTTTSGPGLALKTEMIGLAVIAELPLVIVNVQRGGPSTGMPSRTEQSDLDHAIRAGTFHGPSSAFSMWFTRER
jgi:hypothetical protein